MVSWERAGDWSAAGNEKQNYGQEETRVMELLTGGGGTVRGLGPATIQIYQKTLGVVTILEADGLAGYGMRQAKAEDCPMAVRSHSAS